MGGPFVVEGVKDTTDNRNTPTFCPGGINSVDIVGREFWGQQMGGEVKSPLLQGAFDRRNNHESRVVWIPSELFGLQALVNCKR